MLGHNKLLPRISQITPKRYWNPTRQTYRGFAVKNVDDFNYSRNEYMLEGRDARDEEIATYPRVTAQDLTAYKSPPQGVKMLVRDFIQDSLYNPNYGYFSKRAEIFSPVEPINFNEIREAAEFDATVAR
ncbi:7298_t:CDS:1, partial [Acaulospora colombiana]